MMIHWLFKGDAFQSLLFSFAVVTAAGRRIGLEIRLNEAVGANSWLNRRLSRYDSSGPKRTKETRIEQHKKKKDKKDKKKDKKDKKKDKKKKEEVEEEEEEEERRRRYNNRCAIDAFNVCNICSRPTSLHRKKSKPCLADMSFLFSVDDFHSALLQVGNKEKDSEKDRQKERKREKKREKKREREGRFNNASFFLLPHRPAPHSSFEAARSYQFSYTFNYLRASLSVFLSLFLSLFFLHLFFLNFSRFFHDFFFFFCGA